tara:strand:+ start:3712 stop:4461 length:750 start_codon:yes stop_codon:yes gene_type:complete
VDDGSTDGTSDAVKLQYPQTKIVLGNGNLFWAGGMRLAFREVSNSESNYVGFLLLNDDVELKNNFVERILEAKEFCLKKHQKVGIYSGSTIDRNKGLISYGGHLLTKGINNPASKLLQPSNIPQQCHLTNANILFVEKEVIEKVGFFDSRFTHGIADYDFSLRAFKAGFPVYITPGICGFCENDHGNKWSNSKRLKNRIKYLKSPLGLAYNEYLFYVKRHFPNHLLILFVKLWGKTLFPFIWSMTKKPI